MDNTYLKNEQKGSKSKGIEEDWIEKERASIEELRSKTSP